MVAAIGAGAPAAAMLHLFTHAFFKAGLFLCAGIIIHVLHQAQQQAHEHFNVQDIRNLGGLRKKLPFTFWAFVTCGSALAGIPFFSGFLSKDAILSAIAVWKGDDFSWKWLVLGGAFIVSFLTVIYTFRMIWNIFMGDENRTASLPVVEPPVVMRGPVAILAICSVWLMVDINPINFEGWLFNTLHTGGSLHIGMISIISVLWIALAVGAAYFIFRNRTVHADLLLNNFYLDKLYFMVVGKPSWRLAEFTDYLDRRWIDGFIHVSAYAHVTVSHLAGWFDRAIVDGTVNGIASLSRGVGNFTRSFQGGKVQSYILWAILAIIIFLIWTLF
jgi:NADH-quinone oxidoreductase subunit L